MKTKDLNDTPTARDPRPTLVSFALVKRQNAWHGIAIKTKGREVLDEKVLESDDFRAVALDAVDRASHEYWNHGIDPFGPGSEL